VVCDSASPYVIYSGSDEQVIRVLQGVRSVIEGVQSLCVSPEGAYPIVHPPMPVSTSTHMPISTSTHMPISTSMHMHESGTGDGGADVRGDVKEDAVAASHVGM
jgi:hypothetical protein